MPTSTDPAPGHAPFWRRFVAELTLRRVAGAVGWAVVVALLLAPHFQPSGRVVFGRPLFVVLMAYTAAGQWHRRPLPRWGLQVLAVVLAAPLATLFMYAVRRSCSPTGASAVHRSAAAPSHSGS